MRILFNVHSLGKGGAERVIANLSHDFVKKKHNVFIVTCVNEEPEYSFDKNIEIHTLDKKIKNTQNKVFTFPQRRKRLKEKIDILKPDVIISFLPEPNFLILSLKKKLKVPVIISERNDPYKKYKFFIYKYLVKKLYPLADGFVFQTLEAKKYFSFSDKITTRGVIIPNPINKSFINKKFTGKKEKKIVSVGRLVEQKNHELLIDAFSILRKDFPEYELIIYGEGRLREKLEKKIKKLGIEDCVSLPGKKDDIKKYIYDASMFVLSSNYEGLPNALIEAMVLGLPVISTNCSSGGPRSLISNGENGLLTEVNSVDDLVNAMKIILENEDFAETISDNAQKISSKLHPEIINNRWTEYIEKIER